MDEVLLGAEEVATKEFRVTLRGFSQHDVRSFLAQVAAELAAAKERERLQRERLEAAEARSSRLPSEDDLEAALGQEASKVLHAAREAAAEIRARAEEQVERLVREASGEGNRAQQEAESILARRTEEAERVAGEILAEARRQAEDEVESAKAQGREMLAEAQAVRERVLKDLARRRRLAHQQLEQLRAGRERLLDAYRVVRSTLDEATSELSVVESEARAAAETASLRVGAQPEATVEELEAELSAARDLGLELLPSPAPSSSRSTNGNGNGHGDGHGNDNGNDKGRTALAGAGPADDPLPVEVAEPVDEARPVEAPEPVELAEPEFEPVALSETAGSEPVELEDLEAPAVPGGVEELFARLRAERAETVSRAADLLAGDFPAEPEPASADAPSFNGDTVGNGPGPTGPGPTGPGPAEADAADVDASDLDPGDPDLADAGRGPTDEDVLQVRDAELQPVERSLIKGLKRGLADEQNEVLDSLRRCRGVVTLDDLLPIPSAHTARYLAVAVPELHAAAAAGAGTASPPSVDDLAAGLAAEMVDDLRARVQRALEAADGEERALTDGVSAAYREWKTSRTEPLARHHVAAAHVRGRFAAAPEGSLRWIVDDDEGPCPDCDDNALAGPTPKGAAFPTGQLHPPAHVGCRCTIVAAG